VRTRRRVDWQITHLPSKIVVNMGLLSKHNLHLSIYSKDKKEIEAK
jgi:hypothetical protein